MVDLSLLHRLASSRIQINENTNVNDVKLSLLYPIPCGCSTGELMDHQTAHSARMNFVLDTKGSAADTSPAGLGKTHSGSYCSKKQRLPAFVLCTKAAIPMWYKTLKAYDVPIVSITNYDMARSSHSDTTVKWYDMRNGFTDVATICPWITKEKTLVKKMAAQTKENVRYKWHLPYRCIIICDEEHMGKNVHTQTFALIQGAIQAAKKQGHKTLFLSATPIEKKVNLKSIMYFLGLIPKPDMSHVNTYFREHVGSTEITDIHNYLYAIYPDNPGKSTGSISSMPPAKIPEGIINDVKPVTYPMTEETTKKIAETNKEILLLRARLKERIYESTLGAINANRRFVETYKIDKAEELILAGLRGNFPVQSKEGATTYKQFKRVSIYVNYKSTLHELHKRLTPKKAPLDDRVQLLGPYISLLHGDQQAQESDEAISSYNEGKTKILISTIQKGGVSLSFHDTVGDKETLVIIFPPTSATNLQQCLGRSFRTNVKSSVTQIILFAQGDKVEENIRDALALKIEDMLNFTTGKGNNFDLYDLVGDHILKELEGQQPKNVEPYSNNE